MVIVHTSTLRVVRMKSNHYFTIESSQKRGVRWKKERRLTWRREGAVSKVSFHPHRRFVDKKAGLCGRGRREKRGSQRGGERKGAFSGEESGNSDVGEKGGSVGRPVVYLFEPPDPDRVEPVH
ncbi:hypothetical protein L1987_48233 [Smallanthus sonchifolius]|uniref:Uncharacterized protein n=1 Tax=Smallanthus sonchifolius TaxID=185202 RepID=A0ACB9FSC8_9ASTR|nr:hypothetical protein L1987_48233 [Smallanthus sonchifolius]